MREGRVSKRSGEETDGLTACSGRAQGPPGVHRDRDLGNQGSPGLGARAARDPTAPGGGEAWRTTGSMLWGRAGRGTGARPEELLAGLRTHAQLRVGAVSRPLRRPAPGHQGSCGSPSLWPTLLPLLMLPSMAQPCPLVPAA